MGGDLPWHHPLGNLQRAGEQLDHVDGVSGRLSGALRLSRPAQEEVRCFRRREVFGAGIA